MDPAATTRCATGAVQRRRPTASHHQPAPQPAGLPRWPRPVAPVTLTRWSWWRLRYSAGLRLAAVLVEDYRPPSWPSRPTPKLMRLDLAVADLDAAESEALRLGATRALDQPQPGRWRVLLDPEGICSACPRRFPSSRRTSRAQAWETGQGQPAAAAAAGSGPHLR